MAQYRADSRWFAILAMTLFSVMLFGVAFGCVLVLIRQLAEGPVVVAAASHVAHWVGIGVMIVGSIVLTWLGIEVAQQAALRLRYSWGREPRLFRFVAELRPRGNRFLLLLMTIVLAIMLAAIAFGDWNEGLVAKLSLGAAVGMGVTFCASLTLWGWAIHCEQRAHE
jgi:hypothetical protein